MRIVRDLVCNLNTESKLRGTAVSVLEQPQLSFLALFLSLACWGPSAFLIQTVNISSSRILGQRWSFSKSINHLSFLLWRKKIYLFLRKRHKTQHLIIALSWHLIYFTTRFVFKNRKQIIMPERLQSLPTIPICHHVASREDAGGWGWVGVRRRKGGGAEGLEKWWGGANCQSSTVWNYSLDELLIVFPQLN